MSAINNNPLGSGFAPTGGLPAFSGVTGPTVAPAFAAPGRADNIEFAPYQQAPQDAEFDDPEDCYAAGTSTFGGIYNQLLGSLSNLFANLGSMFGYASNPGTPVPNQPSPQPGGQGQVFFSNATANSVGDPHETFDGTTATGAAVDEKWNSMKSHPNLLDSNSFAGGYRVSTAVTQPNAQGITQNQSATVTTGGGATSVTMNQDGSCAVVSNGQTLNLPVGRAQNLGNGETVTLNADKSLTIVDENGSGGCITTTLKPNGTGGVDVTNHATNVDLGGSLFGHAEYLAGGGASAAPLSPSFAPAPTSFAPAQTTFAAATPTFAPAPTKFGFGDSFVQPEPIPSAIPNEDDFAIT